MKAARAYIERNSIPVPFCGCWLWLKSFGSHGYGNACWRKRVTTAHRLAYRAFKGRIPRGCLVQHSCDARWCVNPDHLTPGTLLTNAQDTQRKGRALKKLTAAQVAAIVASNESGRALARRYGVDGRTIQHHRHYARTGRTPG